MATAHAYAKAVKAEFGGDYVVCLMLGLAYSYAMASFFVATSKREEIANVKDRLIKFIAVHGIAKVPSVEDIKARLPKPVTVQDKINSLMSDLVFRRRTFTTWEKNFLENVDKVALKYGAKSLSEKQVATIGNIYQ